jgi:hypothetical protein
VVVMVVQRRMLPRQRALRRRGALLLVSTQRESRVRAAPRAQAWLVRCAPGVVPGVVAKGRETEGMRFVFFVSVAL